MKKSSKKTGAQGSAARGNKLSYDAANPMSNRQRRRVNVVNLKSEDDVLKPRDRDRLISEGRILRRNAPDVAWMIRTHVGFVSTFNFQCRSGAPELDRRVEELMGWWSRPLNCDVTGRHSFQELIHLCEGLRTTDGDCFVLKLADGRVQIIEGDRVRTPQDVGGYRNFKTSDFLHGVQLNGDGGALNYAVCDRDGNQNGFVLKSILPAGDVLQHGYFDRADQVRGISPIASAINTFADLYESREYALAKAKLAQLFALKLKLAGDGDDSEEPYSFDFGKGPQTLQLSPDDDADFLESKTPSTEFQAFIQTGIQIGLKALDIPYSFFAENYTNYSGARQALNLYEQSCERKRLHVRQILNALTAWRLGLFILDGELELSKGWTLDQVKWEWIPPALPWIDPQKEATANAILLANDLASHQQLAREQGLDWFTIMDQKKAEQDYKAQLGLADTDASGAAAGPDQSVLAQQIAEYVIEAMASQKGN